MSLKKSHVSEKTVIPPVYIMQLLKYCYLFIHHSSMDLDSYWPIVQILQTVTWGKGGRAQLSGKYLFSGKSSALRSLQIGEWWRGPTVLPTAMVFPGMTRRDWLPTWYCRGSVGHSEIFSSFPDVILYFVSQRFLFNIWLNKTSCAKLHTHIFDKNRNNHSQPLWFSKTPPWIQEIDSSFIAED